MKVHRLKCWTEAFEAMKDGRKTFEWRRNDRDYAIGDLLVLYDWDPAAHGGVGGKRSHVLGKEETWSAKAGMHVHPDHVLFRRVTYILEGKHGCPPGWCVMAVVPEPNP